MISPTALLIYSLAALALGPLAYWLARRTGWAQSLLDGFGFVAIGGLVFLHAIPDAFYHSGWLAIGTACLGFLGPWMCERWLDRAGASVHTAALYIGLVGLAFHAVLDGAAIAAAPTALGVAVVLHRIPVSLAICMLLFPRRRWPAVFLGLAALAGATLLGFTLSGAVPAEESAAFGLFEALVSGALLHVVFHLPRVGKTHDSVRSMAAGLGGAAGIALVYLIGMTHGTHHEDISATHGLAAHAFIDLAAASAPALLLAYLGAGLLDSFMPRATVEWMGKGSSFSQSLRGVAFGLPAPICSCGVIPLYRGLILKGTPMAASIAFLVATPEIGVDAVLLSLPLLGVELTLLRVCSAAIVAVLSGWAMSGSGTPLPATAKENVEPASTPVRARLLAVIRSGFGEMVDNTGPWILLGLGIAAIGATILDADAIARFKGWDIPLLALLGIPIYVCASGATPLATMLIFKGVSPGAAIAFLLTGPATNATTFGVLSRLHGARTAARFGALVAMLSVALGFLVNAIQPDVSVFPIGTHHGNSEISTFRWICLTGLLVLFTISMIRQGPRGFVSHVFAMTDGDEADHSHGHGKDGSTHPPSCCHDS